ncbi:type II secretion system minor pseudopilin GspK [Roseateles chitinivorans]|uniref:type II secretion system minor pseudopilin GspK n=1 Tax=Roseateles chitinivorans TaxID=2917965 RepID=UPI003D67E6C1
MRTALPRPPRRMRPPRGAALLTALLIVVLVTTLSAAMLWRQSRSIQIEAADRGRAQADWVLQGALDWARLILAEDAKASRRNVEGQSDNLGEVWAVPLAEARLSSFLSQDENKSEDAGPDAFLSGHIDDAQGLFNLRNLETQPAQPQPGQAPDTQAAQKAIDNLNAARRIFQRAGMSASIAEQVQKSLIASAGGKGSDQQGDVPLRPARIDQLRWFGLNDEQVARLSTLAVLLPKAQTTLNLNTASREVIADVLGVDLGVADSIVRARQSKAFTAWDERLTSLVPGIPATDTRQQMAAFTSAYFFVEGQLRMDDRILAQRSLVFRDGTNVRVIDRQRLQRQSTLAGTTNGYGATP